MVGSTVTVPPLTLCVGAVMTVASLSLSVTLTVPLTEPPGPLGLPTDVDTDGAVFDPLTCTVTGTSMVPPWPSLTVMVKVSV